eukprot:scaffold117138_cov30-Tisochrysis_lutea.AAC.1
MLPLRRERTAVNCNSGHSARGELGGGGGDGGDGLAGGSGGGPGGFGNVGGNDGADGDGHPMIGALGWQPNRPLTNMYWHLEHPPEQWSVPDRRVSLRVKSSSEQCKTGGLGAGIGGKGAGGGEGLPGGGDGGCGGDGGGRGGDGASQAKTASPDRQPKRPLRNKYWQGAQPPEQSKG